jgi:hypothetical protein
VKQIQVVPKAQVDLFRLISGRREGIEASRTNAGAFTVASEARKGNPRTETWKHRNKRWPRGRVKIAQGMGGVVLAQVMCKADAEVESELLGAFVAWLDRNCGDSISAISIHNSD